MCGMDEDLSSLDNAGLHAELRARLRFETLIAELSSRFVNLLADEVDSEIMEAERRLCEFLDLDILAVWQRSDEAPGSFTLTHWYSAQEGPQPSMQLDDDDIPWFRQQMLAGCIVAISSLEEMPAEAAHDREVCRQLGIKSNLSIPLAVGGERPVGALGLNTTRAERDWPEAMVKRLQLVAQIFTNALARKRADEALRESQERLSLTVDSAEAGLWVLDFRTLVFWATTEARMLFGYSPEEVISMDRLKESVHPEDWDSVQGSLERSVKAGEPIDVEYRIRLGDGLVRWIVSRGRPQFASTGEPERLLGLSMDITKRKRAEETSRMSEALLTAGADLAGLGCYEVDFAEPSCFIDERFHEICGVAPGRQSGLQPVQEWVEHLHADDRPRVLDARRELHEGKVEQISIECRYLHPITGQRWIHHVARVAARNTDGHTLRSYGVVRDITDHKEAENETRQLRDSLAHLARVNTLGALSGSLAHELNQPLGIILSNAQAAQELLAQDPPDLTEVRDILADIVAADRRAGEVIGRLREMLKRGEVSLRPLLLNEVIEEVLHIANSDLIGRGITVARDLAADLSPIAGDRVQLQQLVLNLVVNGADAMASTEPGMRRLHFQTKLHHGRVQASVRDEGAGLPADPDRLFQPFYSTKPQGLGLGLSICQAIVAAHHGRLWAEPHPDRGAVFHFELPIAGSLVNP